MTTVVNIKNEPCDVYCGRGSPYGNYYQIGVHGTRNEVIELFRIDFYKKLQFPSFRVKIKSLHGKRLGCWCKPLDCHCDIIADYLNRCEPVTTLFELYARNKRHE